MRWYKIVIGGETKYDSTQNPNALNIEMDIPVTYQDVANPGSFVRVWGIDLTDLLNAKQLNNQSIQIFGGMQKGLPLANPSEQGLLVQGSILPAFGNWVGTDMTLDIMIRAGVGNTTTDQPANVIHNWSQNTQLSDSIKQTLQTAYPGYDITVNISQNLVQASPAWGFYPNIGQFSSYINNISRSIINNPDYYGVRIVIDGKKITVDDGTTKSDQKLISYQDLVGQPIWMGPNEIQFKCVMRGDIHVLDYVTLPPTLATLTGASGSQAQNTAATNLAQGTFQIMSVRHTGNFRQPDWASWVSVFNGIIQP